MSRKYNYFFELIIAHLGGGGGGVGGQSHFQGGANLVVFELQTKGFTAIQNIHVQV